MTMLRTRPRGLTLAEIIVALGIMGILMAIALPQYRNFRDRRTAEGAALVLASDIRERMQRAKTLDVTPSTGVCGLAFDPTSTAAVYKVVEGQIDPITNTAIPPHLVRTVDFVKEYGTDITITRSPDTDLVFFVDPLDSWKGTVTVNCQGQTVTVTVNTAGVTWQANW